MWRKILIGAAILPAVTGAVFAQTTLRVNQIADVQGVRTACGGASLEDQQAMSAQGYPIILKLAGANGLSKAVSFTVGTGARDVMIRFPEITEGGAQPL